MAKLGNLIEQIRGVSYKPEDLYDNLNEKSITLLRANNIQDGQLNFEDVVYVDRKRVHRNQLLKAGDILICTSSGSKELVGKAAYVSVDLPITFGAFCKVIRPQKIYPKYVGHFFNSSAYRQKISNSSAGANINNIRNEHIDELEIPIPNIQYQLAIVTILDKLDVLISLRKQQIAKLDELVKAQFVEMFGDEQKNDNGWDIYKWDEIFDVTTGKLDSNAAVDGGKYPFFTCAKDWLWINHFAFDCEALLLAGNNAAGIYDVKYYKGKFNAYQRTYVLSLKNRNWQYPMFKYQLENRLSYLQQQSKGTNTRYLTLGILGTLKFIVPPTYLQKEFSGFVAKTDKCKLTIQQSLDKLEMLKKALMQKYFG